VRRSLFAGDLEVASFPPVKIGAGSQGPLSAEIPFTKGACAGLFAPIPPGRLGPGGYILHVEVDGVGSQPIIHRAGFALNAAPSEPGGS